MPNASITNPNGRERRKSIHCVAADAAALVSVALFWAAVLNLHAVLHVIQSW